MENVEITVWRKLNCNFYNKRCRKSKRQRRAGFVDVAERIDGEGENDAKSGNI